jgi:beta-xylosidase
MTGRRPASASEGGVAGSAAEVAGQDGRAAGGRDGAGQPAVVPALRGLAEPGYLAGALAGPHSGSSVDPTPRFPFGHGLSYTTFSYDDLAIRAVTDGGAVDGQRTADAATIGTDGAAEIACTVRNAGPVAGDEVVQLYLRDPVAQVARPVRYLAGFARVTLAPGTARRVAFVLHADRTAFHGVSGARVVEPGTIEVGIGSSSADLRLTGRLELTGPERQVGADRVLTTPVTVADA